MCLRFCLLYACAVSKIQVKKLWYRLNPYRYRSSAWVSAMFSQSGHGLNAHKTNAELIQNVWPKTWFNPLRKKKIKKRIFAYLRNQENTRKASMFSIFPQIGRAYWEREWTLCFQGTHFGWFLRIILSYPAWRSEKHRKWCLVEKHDKNKRNELSEKT